MVCLLLCWFSVLSIFYSLWIQFNGLNFYCQNISKAKKRSSEKLKNCAGSCCCYLLTTHPNGRITWTKYKEEKQRTIRKSLNSYLKTQKDSLTICFLFYLHFAVLNGYFAVVYWNTFWLIIYGTFLCLFCVLI